MRTNSGMTKKSVRKFAVLLALVLCFAVAFGVTMAIGTNGSMDGAILNNVASAADEGAWIKDGDGEQTYGAAGAINSDNFPLTNGTSKFSADALFKTGSTDATTWSASINYDSLQREGSQAGGPTNIQLYKLNRDCDVYSYYAGGVWRIGVADSALDVQCSSAMTFKVPTELEMLINNSNFTVSATFTFKFAQRSDISNSGKVWQVFSICSESDPPTAKSYCQTSVGKECANLNTTYTSDPVTFSPGQNCVSWGTAFLAGGTWSSKTKYIEVSNFRINYTVTLKSFTDNSSTLINDGSAPVKVGEVFNGIANSSFTNGQAKQGSTIVEEYTPYVTDIKSMPVYYDEISRNLTPYLDMRTEDTSTYLNSFVSEQKNGSYNNFAYRKSAKIMFADTFNYAGLSNADKFDPKNGSNDYLKYAGISGFTYSGGQWVPGSTSDRTLKMVSGIKTVDITISFTDFDVEDWTHKFTLSEVIGGEWQQVNRTTPSGANAGYVRIDVNNRAKVTMSVYMNCNATVTIQVKDYGGSKNADGTITETSEVCTSVTRFSGIDYEKPTADVADGPTKLELDGYISNYQDYDTLNNISYWYKRNLFESELSSGEDKNDGNAPHIWFYVVQKADSLDALKNLTQTSYSNVNSIKNAGLLPIGYGSITSFTYDFDKGYAIVSGVDTKPYNVNNLASYGAKTGAGYYMFTFYKCDIAGNAGEVVSHYVKVDYEKPNYTAEFTYMEGDSQSAPLDIYASLEKADWALGEATLKLTVPELNFSGNTFRFEDADKEYILTIDRAGNFALYNEKELIKKGRAGDKLEFTISTYIQSTKVYVQYEAVVVNYNGTSRTEGRIKITFEGKNNDRFPTVAWITGFNLSTVCYADMSAMDNDDSQLYADSQGEAKIFIDRHDPDRPQLIDDDSYLNENTNYTISNGVKWKTDNYYLDSTLAFEDFVADVDLFQRYITVYTGFVNVKSLAEFAGLKGKFDEAYKTIRTLEDANRAGFNRLYIRNMSQLDNMSSPYPIEFFANNGSGMRILYTWVVDQAGRVSPLYSSYVLIDISNYSVSADMLEAIIGDKNFGANGKITFTNEDDAPVTSFKRGQSVKFTVELEAGYVPYRFSNGENDSVRYLLENLTANKTMLKTGALDEFISFNVADDNTYVITFKIDDNTNFGALESNLKFGMSARKVVTKTPSYNKYYNAVKLDEDMLDYVMLDDENAVPYLMFNYYNADSDGNGGFTKGAEFAEGDSPLNVGTYFVEIFIPTDNVAFVLRPSASEAISGKVEPIQFIILKGLVTIAPNATKSMYGAGITLTYKIDGFIEDNATGERLVGTLKLDNANWTGDTSNFMMFNVGSYAIIQDSSDPFRIEYQNQSVSQNYDVRFVSNVYHTVEQRVVEINVFKDGKQFGDVDPATRFTVDPTQFDWYTGTNINSLLGTIFAGYKTPTQQDGLYLYDSNGRITRVSGENRGNYRYIAPNSSAFDVNSNYTVSLTIDSDCVFTISPRQIAIDANYQSTTIRYSDLANLEQILKDINVGYIIPSKDMIYANDIEKAINGLITLALKGEMPNDNYYKEFTYNISFDGKNTVSIMDGNIEITLSGEQIYYVYVGKPGTVIVKLKDGAKFTFVYGQQFNGSFLAFDSNMFDVEFDGDAVDYDTVNWTYSITGFDTNDFMPVGIYNVAVSNVQLIKDNAPLADVTVVVESFTASITPATIVVSPTYKEIGNATKTYGESDTVFNIGFEIKSINGRENLSSYGDFSIAEIFAQITGAFARGRYAQNNEFRAMGAQFDDATDAQGNILVGEAGDYYGFMVSTAFSYADSNFIIDTNLRKEVHFVINPKPIDLDVNNFVGVSKAHDTTFNVTFGSTVAYDITGKLARFADDVKLAFNAIYTTAGSPTERTEAGIIFTNLHLEGAQAHNYVLRNI